MPIPGKIFSSLSYRLFFFYWKTSLIRWQDAANFRVFGQRMKSLVSKETVGNRTTKITNAKQVERIQILWFWRRADYSAQLTHSAPAHTVQFPYVLHVQPLCTLAHTTAVHYRQLCKDLYFDSRRLVLFSYSATDWFHNVSIKKKKKREKNSNNKNVPITFFIL